VKRISITGPESTGKSKLAQQLADYFNTRFVPEIAREYLETLGRPYEYEDIFAIAKEQMKQENYLSQEVKEMLFCDTDLLVIKVWSRYKYGKCDPWIESELNHHRYDLYLLCNVDLPWIEDPLREHPNQREELFEIYRNELDCMKVNYSIISGIGEERLQNAICAVKSAFALEVAHNKMHDGTR